MQAIVTPFQTLGAGHTFETMTRVLGLIALVGALMVTGVAGASPASQVRLPVSVIDEESADDADSVVVEKGDHLWKISARHLGAEAAIRDIAPYWRQVVDVNTPRLRSRDPDLIYPGEVVKLPATREQQ
jgi:nucleoid-associated protein YgaU